VKAVGAIRPTRLLPRIRALRLIASALLVATISAVILDVALWAGQRFAPPPVSFIQGQAVYVGEMFMALAYAAMGWLLATRLPRNLLGWLFLLIGLAMALQMSSTFIVQQGHQAFRAFDTLTLLGAWLTSTAHLPLTIVLIVFVFVLFPDGRPLSPRWAAAGWVTLVGASLVTLAVGLSPEGLMWFPSLPNLFAAPAQARPLLALAGGAGLALIVGGVLVATSAMVVRYRQSERVERAQLRWIAVAVLLLSAGGLPFVVARYAFRVDYASGELLLTVAVVAGGFLPIAAAVAVLRHRLYDIDLLINRALVYIPLTGILGGLYTAGVATFQRIFVYVTGDRSDAAIIITTLVMASLFTPVRNWLQAFVDRRFKPVTPAGQSLAGPAADDVVARLNGLEERLSRLESG
jgi:hypothetical protein